MCGCVLDDGMVDRVELTGLVDLATRTIARGGAAPDDQGRRRRAAAGPDADPGTDAAGLGRRAADDPLGAAAPPA